MLAYDMATETSDEARVLAENVRRLREARGWSQEKLGEVAEVTEQTIQNIEAKRGSPRSSTLHKVAKALGVDLPRLYAVPGRNGDPGGTVSSMPVALVELLNSDQGRKLAITPDEVGALLGYSFRGTPTVESYVFFLKAIRAQK